MRRYADRQFAARYTRRGLIALQRMLETLGIEDVATLQMLLADEDALFELSTNADVLGEVWLYANKVETELGYAMDYSREGINDE